MCQTILFIVIASGGKGARGVCKGCKISKMKIAVKNLQWSIKFSVGNQLCKSGPTESLSFILLSFPFPLTQESATRNVQRAILTSFTLKRKHWKPQWLEAAMVGSRNGWELRWLGGAMTGSCNGWKSQWLGAANG